MKIELFIFGVTAFFIADTYYEGKYSRILRSGKNTTKWPQLHLWQCHFTYLLKKIQMKEKMF